MKQLASYVSRSVFGAMVVVLLVLLGLEIVFTFIGELQDVKGGYTASEALIYILLTGPRRAYEMLPTAALIGGIAGLGLLANHSELTVMRAAGVSIGRIVWWVIKPALLLAVAGLLLGQYVVPHTEAMAEARKAEAQGHGYQGSWLNSYWHRDGDNLLRIGAVGPDGELRDMVMFHFTADGHLEAGTRVETARHDASGWQLSGLHETRLHPDGSAQADVIPRGHWAGSLTPEFLHLVTQQPEDLSITNLYRYARYMQQQGLDAGSHFLEFWKKALGPLAIISMVLVACSFIFGPLRSVTMGLRILAGVMAGLLFRYGQDFLGYASLVYNFSPLLAAALPVALCLGIGGVAIARVR